MELRKIDGKNIWKILGLSCEPENEAAKALYHCAGFRENGALRGSEIVRFPWR